MLRRQVLERSGIRLARSMATKQKLNVQQFPRPPLLEKTGRHLQIRWKDALIADTKEAYWVLETHHPPSACPLPQQDPMTASFVDEQQHTTSRPRPSKSPSPRPHAARTASGKARRPTTRSSIPRRARRSPTASGRTSDPRRASGPSRTTSHSMRGRGTATSTARRSSRSRATSTAGG
jgi:nucleotidyltransferase-like protein